MNKRTAIISMTSLFFSVGCEEGSAPIHDGWAPDYEVGETLDAARIGDGANLKVWRPIVADADRDGVWSAGEQLDISVVLSNRSDRDFNRYPGVWLQTDDPAFVIDNPVWYYYAIFAGTSYPTGFTVTAPEDTPSGTVVEFTASVIRGACDPTGPACPSLNPIYFSAVVE
jgi:hypothetical protein